MKHNLLLELGTEEVPASYLKPAAKALGDSFTSLLVELRLNRTPEPGPTITTFTPRRIVLFVTDIPDRQEDRTEELQGPPARVAFDKEGKPTPAALGFARTNKLEVKDLTVRKVGEKSPVDYVFGSRHVPGRRTIDLLAERLPLLIAAMPFPKSMHWLDPDFTFARPLRSALCLYGSDVVPFTLNGVSTGRVAFGHPFLAPERIELAEADYELYRRLLSDAFVVVDADERGESVRTQIQSILSVHGASLDYPELLEEVTNLVEFPTAIEGSFDAKFLALPPEVVVTAMTEHQRYFPVHDAAGKLLARFVTVANRTPEHTDAIRLGNERVLAARLNDAAFFWKEDRKSPLADKVVKLDAVTFQEQLGSYGDRTRRLEQLCAFMCQELSLDPDLRDHVRRAAHLAKADLVTHMVFEFPVLQGVMGREYAKADREPRDIAEAIAEHYQPRSASDSPPVSLTGALVALADKFDALVGCFSVGLIPTGSQDPYALRRQTIGIIRILLAHDLHLSFSRVVEHARSLLPVTTPIPDDSTPAVMGFIKDRLYTFFLDSRVPHELIRAVLETSFDDVVDTRVRLDSLVELAKSGDWNRLCIAVERTHNITREFKVAGPVDESLLVETDEKTLYALYRKVEGRMRELLDARKYLEVGRLYEETFAGPLHTFFENVFVNVEDPALRANRLTLLKLINSLYADRVADLSQVPRPPENNRENKRR